MKRSLLLIVCMFSAVALLARQTTFFVVPDPGDGSVEFLNPGKKTITSSGYWRLREPGDFVPDAGANGDGPMMRIKACNVQVNFDGYCIKNADTNDKLVIGIEVGYRREELLSDPTLQQISNVTILKPSFINFDVGILVHQGVQNVNIIDGEFIDCSYGIIFMGQGQNKNEQIVCACVDNCKIFGHGKDKQDKLVKLKERIEEKPVPGDPDPAPCFYGYGYGHNGTNFTTAFSSPDDEPFMPLRAGAHTYGGIFARHVKGLKIRNTFIEHVGYEDYVANPETNKTEAVGIITRNCREVDVLDSKVYCCLSELKAVGMQMEQCSEMCIKHSECSHNKSDGTCFGLEVLNVSAVEYSLNQLDIDHVRCELHDGKEFTSGVCLSDTVNAHICNLACERNSGENTVCGFYAIKLDCSDVCNSYFNNNKADRASNDLATTFGVFCGGIHLINSNNVEFRYVDARCNYGRNTGFGAWLITSQCLHFDHCTFAYNKGNEMRSNEELALLVAQDANAISKHAPSNVVYTGGYGVVATDSSYCKILNSTANYNHGHRSVGIWFKDCDVCEVSDCSASYQTADGYCLDSNFKTNAGDPSAIATKVPHRVCLFGDSGLTAVSLKAEVDNYLAKSEEIRGHQAAGTESSIPQASLLSLFGSLVKCQGTLARFRIWGTAIGIACFNVARCVIKDSQCVGQTSDRDSALGIAFGGTCDHNIVDNCVTSQNEAWKESKKTAAPAGASYLYRYDLSCMKDFWDHITWDGVSANNWTEAGTTLVDGFYLTGGFFAQGQKDFGDGTTGDTITVDTTGGVGGAGGTNRTLIAPCGPMAAGIVLSDCFEFGRITNCTAESNLGNAGQCHGITANFATISTIQNNLVVSNCANIYGWTCGIMDVNDAASNAWLQNYLSKNKIDTYYNANHCIAFNIGAACDLQLTVPCVYSRTPSPLGTLENVEVRCGTGNFYTVENCNEAYCPDVRVKEVVNPITVSDITNPISIDATVGPIDVVITNTDAITVDIITTNDCENCQGDDTFTTDAC